MGQAEVMKHSCPIHQTMLGSTKRVLQGLYMIFAPLKTELCSERVPLCLMWLSIGLARRYGRQSFGKGIRLRLVSNKATRKHFSSQADIIGNEPLIQKGYCICAQIIHDPGVYSLNKNGK